VREAVTARPRRLAVVGAVEEGEIATARHPNRSEAAEDGLRGAATTDARRQRYASLGVDAAHEASAIATELLSDEKSGDRNELVAQSHANNLPGSRYPRRGVRRSGSVRRAQQVRRMGSQLGGGNHRETGEEREELGHLGMARSKRRAQSCPADSRESNSQGRSPVSREPVSPLGASGGPAPVQIKGPCCVRDSYRSGAALRALARRASCREIHPLLLVAALDIAGCGGGGGSCNPAPAAVATVVVTLGASTLEVGQSTQATALARDADGNVLAGRLSTWMTSSAAIAVVNASTGLVNGVRCQIWIG